MASGAREATKATATRGPMTIDSVNQQPRMRGARAEEPSEYPPVFERRRPETTSGCSSGIYAGNEATSGSTRTR